MKKSIAARFKSQLNALARQSKSNMGDIIIFTTVAGWMASSAAQVYGIATNKNYTHEQKKYMINQEVWDAVANIALYFGITKTLTWLSTNMVKTAKLAPKSVLDFMRKNNLIQNRGQFGFDVSAARGFMQEPGLKGKFDSFKCFADATAATIGGIISSNIITPMFRNSVAAYRQNRYKERVAANSVQQPINPVKRNPVNDKAQYPYHTTFDAFRSRVLSV